MFEDEDLDHPDFGRPYRAPPVEWGSWSSLVMKPNKIQSMALSLAFLEKSCVRYLDAFGPDLWLLELYNGARYHLHLQDLVLGSFDGTTPEKSGRVTVSPAGVTDDPLPEYQHRRVQDADVLILLASRENLETSGVDRVRITSPDLTEHESDLVLRHAERLEASSYWCVIDFEGHLELWVAEPKGNT